MCSIVQSLVRRSVTSLALINCIPLPASAAEDAGWFRTFRWSERCVWEPDRRCHLSKHRSAVPITCAIIRPQSWLLELVPLNEDNSPLAQMSCRAILFYYLWDGNSSTQFRCRFGRITKRFGRPCPRRIAFERDIVLAKGWSVFVVRLLDHHSCNDCAPPPLSWPCSISTCNREFHFCFIQGWLMDGPFGTQLIIQKVWNLKYGIRYFTCSTWYYCRHLPVQQVLFGSFVNESTGISIWKPPLRPLLDRSFYNNSPHAVHCWSVKLLSKWSSFNSHLQTAWFYNIIRVAFKFQSGALSAAGHPNALFMGSPGGGPPLELIYTKRGFS